MSNSKKILDFEICDFQTVYSANKQIKIEDICNNQLDNITYDTTPNGLLVVFSEESSSRQNISLLKIFNQTILAFFKKQYYVNAQQGIEAAFNYANKKIFYSSKHNFRLAGRKINCLIVLIRDKKIFYGSVGSCNLFIKNSMSIERLTPKQENFQNYQFIEIKSLKTSDLEQKLEINTNNSPYFPFKGDIVIITSPSYTQNSDDIINEIFSENIEIEKACFSLLEHYSENKEIENPNFVLVKLNFKGGNYSNKGTFGFYYENFFQKIINAITSVPVLILLAVLVIALFIFVFKQ